MGTHYFRIQQGHYSLEEMQKHSSGDGGDGAGSLGGLCATRTIGELMRNTAFFGDDETEVVVLEGREICDIYDGVRIYPTRIVKVFGYKEFKEAVSDGTAYDYETW